MFRCLFPAHDELHAYAERIVATLQLDPAALPGATLTDYDVVQAGVVHREGCLQTELVVMRPGADVPPHTHPGVDTIEVPLAGSIRLKVGGVDPFAWVPDERLPGFVKGRGMRIPGDVVHGGAAHPVLGAAFLSIQRWPAPARVQLGENFVADGMTALPRRAGGVKGSYRPVGPEDIAYVGARLRAGDLDEIRAVHGSACDPVQVLAEGVRASTFSRTGLAPDGEPICLLGIAATSMLEGIGSPWLLGTEGVLRYPVAFVREGRRLIESWAQTFPVMRNHVDARNAVSVAWLRRLGFTVHPPAPHGASGLPFHLFEKKASP